MDAQTHRQPNPADRAADPADAGNPTYLLSLSLPERHRLMREQAEAAAATYGTDLARPARDWELTAFTALAGEPFLEPAEMW